MKQQIIVDITEHDVELFRGLVESLVKNQSIVWSFPSETSDDTIEITFIPGGQDE